MYAGILIFLLIKSTLILFKIQNERTHTERHKEKTSQNQKTQEKVIILNYFLFVFFNSSILKLKKHKFISQK